MPSDIVFLAGAGRHKIRPTRVSNLVKSWAVKARHSWGCISSNEVSHDLNLGANLALVLATGSFHTTDVTVVTLEKKLATFFLLIP